MDFVLNKRETETECEKKKTKQNKQNKQTNKPDCVISGCE